MRRFKYDNGTEGVSYESLDELLELPNIEVTEYGDLYYVKVIKPAPYYLTMYEVDKKTRKASYYYDYIGYMIDIESKATPVDPKTLKRVS